MKTVKWYYTEFNALSISTHIRFYLNNINKSSMFATHTKNSTTNQSILVIYM
jgi:hypothetical protein